MFIRLCRPKKKFVYSHVPFCNAISKEFPVLSILFEKGCLNIYSSWNGYCSRILSVFKLCAFRPYCSELRQQFYLMFKHDPATILASKRWFSSYLQASTKVHLEKQHTKVRLCLKSSGGCFHGHVRRQRNDNHSNQLQRAAVRFVLSTQRSGVSLGGPRWFWLIRQPWLWFAISLETYDLACPRFGNQPFLK